MEDEDLLGEDGFKIADDDAQIEDLEGMNDFGLEEENPDRDH